MSDGLRAPRLAMQMPERSLLEALAIGLARQGLPPVAGAFLSPAAICEAALTREIEVVLIAAVNEGANSGAIAGAVAVARALRVSRPEIGIALLVGATASELSVAEAVRTRIVDGVMLSSASLAEIALGIRRIAAGERVLPTEAVSRVSEGGAGGAGGAGGVGPGRGATREGLPALSPRQLDVLELLAGGHSNEEVANELHVSVNTVKYHVRGLYRRLGVSTRVQATRVLVERGGGARRPLLVRDGGYSFSRSEPASLEPAPDSGPPGARGSVGPPGIGSPL